MTTRLVSPTLKTFLGLVLGVVATTPNTRPKNVFKVGDTKRVVIEILSRYRKVAGDEAGMNGLRI